MDLPAETTTAYLRHAFDQMLALADALGDDRLNVPPAGPGTNGVGALVVHCCGMTEYWLGHVALGRADHRDREAEFRAQPTAAACRALVRATLAQAADDLARLDVAGRPGQPRRDDLPGGSGSDAAVALHVLEELYQHLGQMELTKDVLLGRA